MYDNEKIKTPSNPNFADGQWIKMRDISTIQFEIEVTMIKSYFDLDKLRDSDKKGFRTIEGELNPPDSNLYKSDKNTNKDKKTITLKKLDIYNNMNIQLSSPAEIKDNKTFQFIDYPDYKYILVLLHPNTIDSIIKEINSNDCKIVVSVLFENSYYDSYCEYINDIYLENEIGKVKSINVISKSINKFINQQNCTREEVKTHFEKIDADYKEMQNYIDHYVTEFSRAIDDDKDNFQIIHILITITIIMLCLILYKIFV